MEEVPKEPYGKKAIGKRVVEPFKKREAGKEVKDANPEKAETTIREVIRYEDRQQRPSRWPNLLLHPC
jgi:hypothetical protein